jgi:hypothetical protein
MKELPYFRFTVQEWQNGDVTLLDYEHQGLFVNVCCYYWLNNCNISLAKLKRRFSHAQATLESLLEEGIIKKDRLGDGLTIDFLDEQYETLTKKSLRLSKAGKKGYLAKVSQAKAKLKGGSKGGLSYKDKDKDKDKDNITSFSGRKDQVWNTICDKFNLEHKTQKEKKRVGAAVRDLKQKEATKDRIWYSRLDLFFLKRK